jgi:hypothetical protein
MKNRRTRAVTNPVMTSRYHVRSQWRDILIHCGDFCSFQRAEIPTLRNADSWFAESPATMLRVWAERRMGTKLVAVALRLTYFHASSARVAQLDRASASGAEG